MNILAFNDHKYKSIICIQIIGLLCVTPFFIQAQTLGYFSIEKGIPIYSSLSSAPSPAAQGMIYFNTTDYTLYWYNGDQWTAVSGKNAGLSLPEARSVSISGTAKVNSILTGTYTFYDPLGYTEGTETIASVYQWYSATNADGTDKAPIDGATSLSCTITSPSMAGKYIALEIKPRSSIGLIGKESMSGWLLIN